MKKIVKVAMVLFILFGLLGCTETKNGDVATCTLTTDSGSVVTHKIYYEGEKATKIDIISQISISSNASKDAMLENVEKDNKELFGGSATSSIDTINGVDYLTTTYDLTHDDAHYMFEFYTFYKEVDVKNSDGTYSIEKIINALKAYELFEFTCDK